MDHVRTSLNGKLSAVTPEGTMMSEPSSEPRNWAGLSRYAPASEQAGDTNTVSRRTVPRVRGWADRYDEWKWDLRARFDAFELAPDLAQDIGSFRWFRGLFTLLALIGLALALRPEFPTPKAGVSTPIDAQVQKEFSAQAISPLALGADTGRRMAPTQAVIALATAPERPRIELVSTLAAGDTFEGVLRRAGAAAADIAWVSALISEAIPLEDLKPGTPIDIVLGRRPEGSARRPVESLALRALFELELKIEREARDELGNPIGALVLERKPIRVDKTPLRIRGEVGSSLYRSMRAAGVPASAVQAYLRALDGQINMSREVRALDEFDIIIGYHRAATGERQAGKLLYAALERRGKPRAQLMAWGDEGRFYEASGVGEQREGLARPVPGRITSGYGMRRHPILGYRRMHSGMDFRARKGTPIVAVSDGRVTSAGRAGGCGITVRIRHSGGLSTRYCHMTRKAVRSGARVKRGQVIGYVGSTGLSTGPHLHYEMYRNGKAINPASVKFVTRQTLSGSELKDFKRQLETLRTVEPGAALKDLVPHSNERDEPQREIEKIGRAAR